MDNMRIVIDCLPGCGVINFEITFSFLSFKKFMTKILCEQ